jgi:hypothetical protein
MRWYLVEMFQVILRDDLALQQLLEEELSVALETILDDLISWKQGVAGLVVLVEWDHVHQFLGIVGHLMSHS